jgi:uncharacterized membrane protein
MNGAMRAVTALVFAGYPLAVYFGLARFGLAPVAWLLALLAILRLLLLRGRTIAWPIALLALAMASLSLVTLDGVWLRCYPVLVNGVALAAFGWSLQSPPSMIERFARLRHPDLPPAGVAWTRKVTQVWCAFFLCNGAVALYTALRASVAAWTLYNGLISYLLMGALLGGEWLLRPKRAAHREA